MTTEPLYKPDIVKHCNVNASGCHITYNLSARSEEELGPQFKEYAKKPKYKSHYDACDNPRCQGKAP